MPEIKISAIVMLQKIIFLALRTAVSNEDNLLSFSTFVSNIIGNKTGYIFTGFAVQKSF